MEIKDIEKLGELAKIDIKPEEAERFKRDFDSILGYINQIESVDVSDVNPVFTQKNITRTDDGEEMSGSHTDRLMQQAPETQDGFIKVKKIL